MKNVKRTSLITAALVFGLASSAQASYYYSGGYSLDVVDYNPSGTSSEYIFQTAADYWNDAADTSVGPGPESNNSAFVYDYQDSWYGQYSPGTNSFSIRLNSRTLETRASNQSGTYLQHAVNTAVHEFGHALYLADLEEGYGNTSIMSYERVYTDHAPRSLDVNNINDFRSGNYSSSETNKVSAEWPILNIDQAVEEADIIGVATVTNSDQKEHKEIDGELMERQFSTLEFNQQMSGELPEEIVLNQALNFVEEDQTYLFFLREGTDGYYYELSDKTIIKEVGNGKFESDIPGMKGEVQSSQLRNQINQ